ncbi:MAG: hypothetical protein J6P20_09600, partial [Oscillospiraceae bacterium]|nr:hypothetical protein [Oscillospiraceae bacterium]
MDDEGEGELVADAQVDADGAAFIAESFSLYVLTSNGYTDKDQAITVNGQAVPNSQTNPYVITVGQELEVRYSGDYVNRVDQGNNNNGFTVYNNGSNVVGRTAGKSETAADGYRTAYFTGLNPGICRIVKITGSGNWGSEQYVADDLWVKVVAPDIYVKTELEYKQIDRVKEYLAGFGMQNQNGYVPNSLEKPYVLRQGDEAEIYITGISSAVVDHYDLSFDANWSPHLNSTTEQKIELIPVSTDEAGITKYRIKGLKAGEVEIRFPNCNKSMWVRVFPEHEDFHHADMEIAEGGKYTLTKTTYENGHTITTVEVYDAFVSRVNHARLLDASGQPLALAPEDNNLVEYKFTSDGIVNGDIIGDYKKIGRSGETQYELTSAFGRRKHYDANDVKSVVFDVDITLQPDCQFTITDGVAGGWSDLSGENKTLSLDWTFNQQGLIDAMNKCPLNNGFDFTIRPNAAYVDLKAVKELNGGTLS